MYFKLDYTIRSLQIGERDGLTIELERPHGPVTVVLSKFQEAELTHGRKPTDFRCVAMTSRWAFEREEVLFSAMSGRVPDGIKPLLDGVRNELGWCINSTIHNIKWMRGLTLAHNPIRYGSALKWSYDGTVWKAVPGEIRLNARIGHAEPMYMKDDEVERIQQQVEKGVLEPLGHQLLSEAFAQAMDNPRSALVMGIAAAETGWKEFAAKMLPQTKWVLENIPSPPLVKMLEGMMPTITTKAGFVGRKASFPPRMLETLRNGVALRNTTVHGGHAKMNDAELDEILATVRDLLYLLDLYSGLLWAAAHVRHETVTTIEAVD